MDDNQTPAFPVIETSAQLLYLQQTYDKDNHFGFAEALQQSAAVQ
jgi:hypothetical protein